MALILMCLWLLTSLGPVHRSHQLSPEYSRVALGRTPLMDDEYNLFSYLQKVKLL